MLQYDLIIKGGTVATASDTFASDIGVKDGRIVALAENLEGATQVVDAAGKLVLPGGIESHCHIEQESASGGMTSDDYYSGSVSAAFGGNTTFIPFAAQHRGQTIADVLNLYHDRAGPKSVALKAGPGARVLAQVNKPRRRRTSLRMANPKPGC